MLLFGIFIYFTVAIFFAILAHSAKKSPVKGCADTSLGPLVVASCFWFIFVLATVPGFLFYLLMKKIGVCE